MNAFERSRWIAMAKLAIPRSKKPRDVLLVQPQLKALRDELDGETILALLRAPYDVEVTPQDAATVLAVFGLTSLSAEQLKTAADAATARRRITAASGG